MADKIQGQKTSVSGVNVIGYFGKCLGVAQSAKLVVASLQKQSIPFSLVSADSLAESHPSETSRLDVSGQFTYPINIFCLDARQIARFVAKSGWNQFKQAYNIGICFWETNKFPRAARESWAYLDEIWTTTHYVHEHLSIAAPIPVYHIPQPVQIPVLPSAPNKATFNLKNCFTFLFYFSFSSVVNRKNPLAVIRAFQQAFPCRQDVQLVIKSQTGELFPRELHALQTEARKDSRIIWLDQTIDAQASYDLMNSVDCYISLHRSEGFGLTMAEAMLLNKPVIATGYSGNLDFMNEDNSFLCHYRLVPIGKHNVYPQDGVWAEVDIDHAAYWMDYVVCHPEEAQAKAEKGREYVLKYHSCEIAGWHMAWRLNKITLPLTSKSKPWTYYKACMRQRIARCKKMVKQTIKSQSSHFG